MPTTIERPPVTSAKARAANLVRAKKIYDQIHKLQEELASLNAVEQPEVTLPELHDPQNGRIDAQRVADFMGVPLKRLAEGLGLNYKAVHRSPAAAGFQEALAPVKRSLELLEFFFKNKETIRVWLNTPHPRFENKTSMEIILDGKAFALARILGCARWGGGL